MRLVKLDRTKRQLRKYAALILTFGFFAFSVEAGFQSSDSPIYTVPRGRTSLGTFSASETIRVTATIAPLFDLSVEVVGGGEALDFGVVRQGESPARQELVIAMRSNLRRPYQIVQEVFGPLQNEQGDTIPSEKFTCVTYGMTGMKTKGNLGAKKPIPVTEKPLVLFVSDEQGKGDYFTVGYQVTPLPDQKAGEYKTVLIFTATLL